VGKFGVGADSNQNSLPVKLVKFSSKHITPTYMDWLNNHEVNRYLHTGRFPVCKEDVYVPSGEKNLLFAMMSKLVPENDGLYESSNYQNYVGTISLHGFDSIIRKAEIGLMVGEQNHWGIGIATEAIGLISDYAFNRLNINKLTAGVVEENIGSYKAFEKNGFERYAEEIQDYYLEGKYLSTYKYHKLNEYTSS